MKKFSTFKFDHKKVFEQEQIEDQEMEMGQEPVGMIEESPISGASKFFSKLFESREMAHVYHLSVKGDMGSYAAHVALGAYYEGILEFIDDLIEIYQGQYGLVENFEVIDTASTKTQTPVEYFEDLVMFVKSERNTSLSAEDTHLQNIVDEVIALIYKTLYKLKYNK
jgi:hypothetical protein